MIILVIKDEKEMIVPSILNLIGNSDKREKEREKKIRSPEKHIVSDIYFGENMNL